VSHNWKGGSTYQWRKKVRPFVLARDGYRCQLKVPGVCTGVAEHVHHTLGKAYGDDPAYLVAACAKCNYAIGDPTKGKDPKGKPEW
jgi:hypothetical protein